MLIRAADSTLVVIDMQERLVPAMQAPADTLKNAGRLLAAAAACNVPAILTEQYPKGLGATMPELISAAGDAPVVPKIHFSCMEEDSFRHTLTPLNRKQVVLAGMEAHICVVQTAMSLMEEDFDVFVVSDATTSRSRDSKAASITRLSTAGVGIVTTEMAIFEWLGRADTQAFKSLLPLIKQ